MGKILTNSDIVSFLKNVTFDVVVDLIRNSKGRYDLSPNGLIDLSKNEVPDKVVCEMIWSMPTWGIPQASESEILLLDRAGVPIKYLECLIDKHNTNFDCSVESIALLRSRGISESILKAMIRSKGYYLEDQPDKSILYLFFGVIIGFLCILKLFL